MSEIEIIPLVSISAIKTKIEGIDNNKLIEEIQSSSEDVDKSYLDNQHHSYYEDRRYPYGKSESEKLLKLLSEKVNTVIGKKLILSEAWTLTLKDGQSVAAHSHKSNKAIHQEEYYSIAYYPSAPEDSADLIFMVTACNTIESSIIITPQQGDLIIFNSYIMHMTNRHRNKETERIVISANFVPEFPNVESSQDWSAYARKDEQQNNKPALHEYELIVSTIFGEEIVNLFLYEDGTGMASNHSSKMTIPSWSVFEGAIKLDFKASVPIDADVSLTMQENENSGLYGYLKIGDYAIHEVRGKRKK